MSNVTRELKDINVSKLNVRNIKGKVFKLDSNIELAVMTLKQYKIEDLKTELERVKNEKELDINSDDKLITDNVDILRYAVETYYGVH